MRQDQRNIIKCPACGAALHLSGWKNRCDSCQAIVIADQDFNIVDHYADSEDAMLITIMVVVAVLLSLAIVADAFWSEVYEKLIPVAITWPIAGFCIYIYFPWYYEWLISPRYTTLGMLIAVICVLGAFVILNLLDMVTYGY